MGLLAAALTVVRLVLASASPSRGQLLQQAGIAFDRCTSDVDEDALAAELGGQVEPAALALALARAKAEAVAATVTANPETADPETPDPDDRTTLVLGCDSLLELDGAVHGKPHTPTAATRRWQQQRGRTATLITGHWLIEAGTGREAGRTVATEVTFVDATDEEIADYVASGEPLGVAGAFTLEGRAGPLIERINGDPSNVIGLSLPGLRTLLQHLGYTLRDVAAAD